MSKRVNGGENGVKMMVKGSVLLGILRILVLGSGCKRASLFNGNVNGKGVGI